LEEDAVETAEGVCRGASYRNTAMASFFFFEDTVSEEETFLDSFITTLSFLDLANADGADAEFV